MDSHPDRHVADIDQRLLRMRALGFKFAAGRDNTGAIADLVAVRVHHGVIDIVELYGEDDVLATRIPGDEPDIARPRTVLWRMSGSAVDVLDGLLDVPDPILDQRIQTPDGCWFPLEPGRMVWFAAADPRT